MKSADSKLSRRVPKGRITSITEFAKYLGLSYCTVSRAINNHPLVSSDTREQVLKAMDEVGFRPNPLARGLRHGGTGLIGVCFVDLNVPVLYNKLSLLQQFLRGERLHGLLEIADRDQNSEIRVIKDFLQIGVEGIVMVNSTMNTRDCRSLLKGIAAVHADPMEAQEMPSVEPDRYHAMQALFQNLLELGHRKFALFGFNEKNRSRWPALRDLARERNLAIDRTFSMFPRTSPGQAITEGRKMAGALLAQKTMPTAIIAMNDEIALGAIQALREKGFRVPEDISVTGFDNLEVARELHPTITTVEQHPEELVRLTVKLLQQQISLPPAARGGKLVEHVALRIVPGESTGPAKN